MRFFAKSVTDPDVCFCQNVVELLSGLSDITTNVAWIAITKRVLTERGLMGIIEEHAENLSGYIVKECYPSDRDVLMNHAEALFEIASSGFNLLENPHVTYVLSRIIKKMGLYNSEKKQLIIKYIYNGDKSCESLAEAFLEVFS